MSSTAATCRNPGPSTRASEGAASRARTYRWAVRSAPGTWSSRSCACSAKAPAVSSPRATASEPIRRTGDGSTGSSIPGVSHQPQLHQVQCPGPAPRLGVPGSVSQRLRVVAGRHGRTPQQGPDHGHPPDRPAGPVTTPEAGEPDVPVRPRLQAAARSLPALLLDPVLEVHQAQLPARGPGVVGGELVGIE